MAKYLDLFSSLEYAQELLERPTTCAADELREAKREVDAMYGDAVDCIDDVAESVSAVESVGVTYPHDNTGYIKDLIDNAFAGSFVPLQNYADCCEEVLEQITRINTGVALRIKKLLDKKNFDVETEIALQFAYEELIDSFAPSRTMAGILEDCMGWNKESVLNMMMLMNMSKFWFMKFDLEAFNESHSFVYKIVDPTRNIMIEARSRHINIYKRGDLKLSFLSGEEKGDLYINTDQGRARLKDIQQFCNDAFNPTEEEITALSLTGTDYSWYNPSMWRREYGILTVA